LHSRHLSFVLSPSSPLRYTSTSRLHEHSPLPLWQRCTQRMSSLPHMSSLPRFSKLSRTGTSKHLTQSPLIKLKITIIGTGLTGLHLAHTLLNHTPPLPIHLTLRDKASKPGGRLTSRAYSNVTLEPGARAFQSFSRDFSRACEGWERKGWVQEVQKGREEMRGVKWEEGERWWEAGLALGLGGGGGWSGSLIKGLVVEHPARTTNR
jgi:hypothetical protein